MYLTTGWERLYTLQFVCRLQCQFAIGGPREMKNNYRWSGGGGNKPENPMRITDTGSNPALIKLFCLLPASWTWRKQLDWGYTTTVKYPV